MEEVRLLWLQVPEKAKVKAVAEVLKAVLQEAVHQRAVLQRLLSRVQQRVLKSRTSSGTAKKNTTGKNTQTEQLLQYSPLIDEIILLLAFACTIILLLSNFNMAGTVGQSIKWLMFGLLG